MNVEFEQISFENKRKSMSFGVYPDTSLSEARVLRDKTKKLLKQNLKKTKLLLIRS